MRTKVVRTIALLGALLVVVAAAYALVRPVDPPEDAPLPDGWARMTLELTPSDPATFEVDGRRVARTIGSSSGPSSGALLSSSGRFAMWFGDVRQVLDLTTGHELPLASVPHHDLHPRAFASDASGNEYLVSVLRDGVGDVVGFAVLSLPDLALVGALAHGGERPELAGGPGVFLVAFEETLFSIALPSLVPSVVAHGEPVADPWIDERTIAFRSDHEVVLVDRATDARARLAVPDEARLEGVSPDGSQVVVGTADYAGDVTSTVYGRDGVRRFTVPGVAVFAPDGTVIAAAGRYATTVTALDLRGNPRWSAPAIGGLVRALDDRVIVAGADGLDVLDLAAGSRVTGVTRTIRNAIGWQGDQLAVGTYRFDVASGRLVALDAAELAPSPYEPSSPHVIEDADGTIHFGEGDHATSTHPDGWASTPDDRHLVVADVNGVSVYALPSGALEHAHPGLWSSGAPVTIVPSRDSRSALFLATFMDCGNGLNDCTFCGSGRLELTADAAVYDRRELYVTNVSLSPRGDVVAAVTPTGAILLPRDLAAPQP